MAATEPHITEAAKVRRDQVRVPVQDQVRSVLSQVGILAIQDVVRLRRKATSTEEAGLQDPEGDPLSTAARSKSPLPGATLSGRLGVGIVALGAALTLGWLVLLALGASRLMAEALSRL
jgi:hypothetical protein